MADEHTDVRLNDLESPKLKKLSSQDSIQGNDDVAYAIDSMLRSPQLDVHVCVNLNTTAALPPLDIGSAVPVLPYRLYKRRFSGMLGFVGPPLRVFAQNCIEDV